MRVTVQTSSVRVLGPAEGKAGFLGSIGVRFLIDGETTGGGFSLVEHPMSAHALAAPLHRHLREDEYSYVLEGRMGALLGDDVLDAGPGDLVFKPRGEWHTFWNGGVAQADPAILGNLCERYGLEMDPASVPELVERFGVRFPAEPLMR